MGQNQVLNKASCLVLVGEKSGEEHFMSFFPELSSMLPSVSFFGVGGDEMERSKVEILYPLKDFGSMGFVEVVGKLAFYRRAMNHLLSEVERRHCRVAILVDFQEFNFNLAQKLKSRGVEVLYFVAPQAWAWRPGRAQVLAKTVNTLYTILPFEKKWFEERGVKNVQNVTHPLLLHAKKNPALDGEENGKKKDELLLLPGSRNKEVASLLPIFLQAVNLLKERGLHLGPVSIVKTSSVDDEHYRCLQEQRLVDHIYDSSDLNEALARARYAFAASGTVTLSCGLAIVPTVVCYQTPLLSSIVYALIIPYRGPFSLTNMVLEKMVFPELIQDRLNAQNLAKIIEYWLTERSDYEKIKTELAKIKGLLSVGTSAVAKSMERVIHESYKEFF